LEKKRKKPSAMNRRSARDSHASGEKEKKGVSPPPDLKRESAENYAYSSSEEGEKRKTIRLRDIPGSMNRSRSEGEKIRLAQREKDRESSDSSSRMSVAKRGSDLYSTRGGGGRGGGGKGRERKGLRISPRRAGRKKRSFSPTLSARGEKVSGTPRTFSREKGRGKVAF